MKGDLEDQIGLQESLQDIFPDVAEFVDQVEDMWKRLHGSFFKRVQLPPAFTLNKASFWMDKREAQNGVYFSKKYQKMKQEILEK